MNQEVTYSRAQAALKWMAVLLVAALCFSVMKIVDYEHHHRFEMVVREEANLLLSFEESVRRDLNGVEEILRELKQKYEKSGKSSRELIEHVQNTRSLPLVHVSIANEKGIIENSTVSKLVSMDITSSEYYPYLRDVDDKKTYFAKPVIGRQTQDWIFHMSRRLNKPDGNFAGTATVGINPSLFGEFYQKMQLGKGFAITIVGLDGYIRVRQTAEKMFVGTDVRSSPLFAMLPTQKAGSFIDISRLDNVNRIYSYRAMSDYPFILAIAVVEDEAMADFFRLRERNWLLAVLGSLGIVCFFALLIRMLTLRNETESALREMNEQLTAKVAHRTKELEGANQELRIIAMLDGLTGIANRRFFDEQYLLLWRTAKRQGKPLAIIIADIDYFKAYNDTYGHQSGDDCLKKVADTLRAATKRGADFVARYGGEEFIIALPDTDGVGAFSFAENLRSQVEALNIVHGKSPMGSVTISLGLAAAVPVEGNTPLGLVEAADKALYNAKNSGRNCVRWTNGDTGHP